MHDIKGIRLTRSRLGGVASLGGKCPACQTGPWAQDGYRRGPVVGHPGPRWLRPAGHLRPDRPGAAEGARRSSQPVLCTRIGGGQVKCPIRSGFDVVKFLMVKVSSTS